MTALLLVDRDPQADLAAALQTLNEARLRPSTRPALALDEEMRLRAIEGDFLATARADVAGRAAAAPRTAPEFMQWFEALRETGPGQNDRLFPSIASRPT